MVTICTDEESATAYTRQDNWSETTNMTDEEANREEMLRHIGNFMNIFVAGIIDLFGLAGNTLVITCMGRQKRLNNMLIILFGLAVADMLLLGFHFVFQVTPNLYVVLPFIPNLTEYFESAKSAAWPLSMAAHSTGILLTVFICAERWFAVCRPLKVRSAFSVGRTKRSVTGIFALCLILNSPRFFEYKHCLMPAAGMETEVMAVTNESTFTTTSQNFTTQSPSSRLSKSSESSNLDVMYMAADEAQHTEDYFDVEVKTQLGRSFFYSTLYSMVIYGITIFVMPLCVLTVMTAHMLIRLERYRRFWESLSKAQQRENSITALPICIVVIFIVCETPAMVINCIDAYQIAVSRTTLRFALACSGFLVVLKCALNILAYSICSSVLKREFKSLVKSIKPMVSTKARSSASRDSTRSQPLLSTIDVAV